MKYRHFQKIVRSIVLALLIFVLSAEPVMVAAKTLQKDPRTEAMDTLVNGGDAYLDSASKVVVGSMELLGYLNAIHNTPLNQISESYISDVISRALDVAEQSSVALGSVNVVADGIEDLGGTLPAAMSVSQEVGAGIPQEMRDELSTLGVSAANIDQVSASTSDLLSARQAGIPANVQADLLGFGFTQSQIDQIAVAVSERGLANNGLTTKLDQFRATQDELADTRSGMLVLAVQLLGYQIAIRQVNGITPTAITDDDMQELAQDELRLLVHAAHLNAMWGSDPSTEVGEGDWWFIEHYAGHAAERLQALTVESQNRSLVAELFVLHQMKMLAVSARTGDAEYAKAELDSLAALLSHQLNVTAYYHERQNPGVVEIAWARVTATPALREKVEWGIPHGAAKNAMLALKERTETAKVENLALIIGSFDESNEVNNTGGMLIVAGLEFFDQLTLDFVQTSLNILAVTTPENLMIWVGAILTGDTDNPALLAANVILSLIPVIGVIPDIITLIKEGAVWMKALSLIGIIGSIGDIVELIPGLQLAGATSFVGDAAATILKSLYRETKSAFKAVLEFLELEDAFKIAIELISTAVEPVLHVLGGTLNEVIAVLRDVFTGGAKLWENFVAFVSRVGADMLLKLGFDEGSALVGRILNLGVDLSDEALVVVDDVGDNIVKAGVELSDDASEGVGVLAKNVDPEDVSKFSDKLLALCGAMGRVPGHAKLAIPALAGTDCINRVEKIIGELDEVAQQGLNKLCKSIGGEEMAALAKNYSETDELANAFKKTLTLSADSKFSSWTSKASAETLDELVEFTSIYDDSYSKSLLSRLCDTDCAKPYFDEQFGNILYFIKNDEVLTEMVGPNSANSIKDGVAGMLKQLNIPESMKGDAYYQTYRGWQFELDQARYYFSQNRLETVHEGFRTFEGKTRFYDLVLNNNVVIEAKYWSRTQIEDSYTKLFQQIVDQANSNSTSVIAVEFASTAENLHLTDSVMVKLRDALFQKYGTRVTIGIVDYVIH